MTQAQPRPRTRKSAAKPAAKPAASAARSLESAKSRHPTSVIPFPAGPPPPFKGIVPLLLLLMAAFCLLGLIMVLSSSMVIDYDNRGSALFHFHRQLIWVGLGWGMLIFTSLVDYRRWAKFATPMLVFSLVLLGLVLVPGQQLGTSSVVRWLLITECGLKGCFHSLRRFGVSGKV